MDNKIKITLTEKQKNLLQQEVKTYIFDKEMERTLSCIITKVGKYYLYLTPEELDELIGNVCFVANHNEDNKKLVKELDILTAKLEKCLEDYDE